MRYQKGNLHCSKKQALMIAQTNVKVMPLYDPDAVISSLALTIPSWTSSIERTRAAANIDEVSSAAQSKLLCQLQCLKFTIDGMMTEIIKGGKAHG